MIDATQPWVYKVAYKVVAIITDHWRTGMRIILFFYFVTTGITLLAGGTGVLAGIPVPGMNMTFSA